MSSDYTGKQVPLLMPARNATPTRQDIDHLIKRLMQWGPPTRITTARCRHCGGDVSISSALEEEPDMEILAHRMEAHQRECWPAIVVATQEDRP